MTKFVFTHRCKFEQETVEDLPLCRIAYKHCHSPCDLLSGLALGKNKNMIVKTPDGIFCNGVIVYFVTNFSEAKAIMRQGESHEDFEEALRYIVSQVEPLCKTHTDGEGGTTLEEWLREGTFDFDVQPEDIAAEWDGLALNA